MIKFFVPGIAKPGGSKKAFFNPKTGRAIVVDACKGNKDWRSAVSSCAYEVMQGRELIHDPIEVTFEFHMPRPKGHFGSKGIRKSAPVFPATRPDVLKLARSVEDSLTGLVYADDSQIVTETLRKVYAEKMAGVWITIRSIESENYSENITEDKSCPNSVTNRQQTLSLS